MINTASGPRGYPLPLLAGLLLLSGLVAGCRCSTSNSLLCSRHQDEAACSADTRCTVESTDCRHGPGCDAECVSNGLLCYNSKPRCVMSYADARRTPRCVKHPAEGDAVCEQVPVRRESTRNTCVDRAGRENPGCRKVPKNSGYICVDQAGGRSDDCRFGPVRMVVNDHECVERNPLVDCSGCRKGFLTCRGKQVCRGVICL